MAQQPVGIAAITWATRNDLRDFVTREVLGGDYANLDASHRTDIDNLAEDAFFEVSNIIKWYAAADSNYGDPAASGASGDAPATLNELFKSKNRTQAAGDRRRGRCGWGSLRTIDDRADWGVSRPDLKHNLRVRSDQRKDLFHVVLMHPVDNPAVWRQQAQHPAIVDGLQRSNPGAEQLLRELGFKLARATVPQ